MSEPQIARSLYMVPVEAIDASGGLRPLDPVWVEALAALLARDGQRRPIEVYPKPGGGYGVIAGRHRLAAVRVLGWATIDADVLEADVLDRRASEVSENLFKLGLSPLDRAAFVAEQIAVEKARAGVSEDATPQSVAANARWAAKIKADAADASDIMSHAFGWTDVVATAAGLNRRTIERDLELHRGLKPAVAEAVRGLPIAANAGQLRALAKLPEAEQREVVGLLVEGAATGVAGAVAVLKQKPVQSPAQKAFSAFVGAWGRMTPSLQKAALAEIASHGLPPGVSVTIDGEVLS